jgi:hypothetical protein
MRYSWYGPRCICMHVFTDRKQHKSSQYGLFLYFAFHNAQLIAAAAGIFWLIGMFAWAAKFRRRKHARQFGRE